MSNFISINDEIVKTIKQRQNSLNEKMSIINESIDKFCEEFHDKPIEDMKKTEEIVNWLKEITVGTKLLQNYFDNFPSVKLPQNEYISDKMQSLESEPVSDEVLKTIPGLIKMSQEKGAKSVGEYLLLKDGILNRLSRVEQTDVILKSKKVNDIFAYNVNIKLEPV